MLLSTGMKANQTQPIMQTQVIQTLCLVHVKKLLHIKLQTTALNCPLLNYIFMPFYYLSLFQREKQYNPEVDMCRQSL